MAAQDIVRDVFLKLWLIRNKLSEIKSISSFLYKLPENKQVALNPKLTQNPGW